MTLLGKAQAATTRPAAKISSEHIELALAWANGQINLTQAVIALGFTPGKSASSAYITLARALRAAVQQGILKQQ